VCYSAQQAFLQGLSHATKMGQRLPAVAAKQRFLKCSSNMGRLPQCLTMAIHVQLALVALLMWPSSDILLPDSAVAQLSMLSATGTVPGKLKHVLTPPRALDSCISPSLGLSCRLQPNSSALQTQAMSMSRKHMWTTRWLYSHLVTCNLAITATYPNQCA
jgi:hypothetical protein